MVENEMGQKVNLLKFDNERENRDEEFKEFCTTDGIKLKKIVPKTPHQNGVAKPYTKL